MQVGDTRRGSRSNRHDLEHNDRSRAGRCRLRIEPLEDRRLLSGGPGQFDPAPFGPLVLSEPEVDIAGPRVIASSVVRDSVVSWGTFVYTARFDEELNASVLDASDIELVGGHSGTYEPASFHYSPMTSTLTVEYAHLPDDIYTLSLRSGDRGGNEGFEDLAGNDLDGEPEPAATIPSGDGTAGGDFVVTFSADGDLFRYPGPLEAKPPWGSLIYDPTANGFIETARPKDSADRGGKSIDTDGWTIDLDAGQTITAVIFATETFQPIVEILDPAGTTIGSATAEAPGERALLQTLPASIDGPYTIEVGAVPGTGGLYMVQLILNAAVEAEEQGGPSNDNPASAQDLDATFLTLGDGRGERGAVLGSLPLEFGPEIASEDFESGVLDESWSSGSDEGGRIQVTDAYGAADGSYALLMDSTDGDFNRNEAIWTVDLSGYTGALLSFSHAEWNDEEHFLQDNFRSPANADGVSISADRTYFWHPVFRVPDQPAGSWYPHIIDLADQAEQVGMVLGKNFKINFQQYDDERLPGDGRGYDAIRITEMAHGEDDWYRFTLDDGQSATMALTTMTTIGPGDLTMELYDERQNLLAVSTDQVIGNFVGRTSNAGPQTYYIHVTGDSGTDYSLVVTREADFEDYGHLPIEGQEITPSSVVLGHASPVTGQEDPVSQWQTLIASDAEFTGSFGRAVSISGSTAVVSASGAAYIYRFNGERWEEQQKLVASDEEHVASFGNAVFIDGETAIVGAEYSHDRLGSAYIFRFDGSQWVEQQKITAFGDEVGSNFGASVALSGDTAIVGGMYSSGAYIFRFDGSRWAEEQKLIPNDPNLKRYFGQSVAIEGNTAMVTDPWRRTEGGFNTGVIHIFQFDGSRWVEQQMVTARTADFIDALALSGNAFVIGVRGYIRREAYVYRFDGNTWTREAGFYSSDVPAYRDRSYEQFGSSVSISGDRLVIGDYGGKGFDTFGGDTGFAYLYEYTEGTWTKQQRLVASQKHLGDNMGISVAISADTIIVGASGVDEGGVNAGAAYVFKEPPPEDRYALSARVDDLLSITTTTPGDGVREFVNELDPRVELYDPDGILVASDDNGATDGRNAMLTHAATQTGTYTVRVLTATDTAGEYVLKVSGQSGDLPPMAVAVSDPADGARRYTAPEQITLQFSDALLVTTLDASDLSIDGMPASRVTLVDGKTAVFDLPVGLRSGAHALTVSAGAVLDLQGTPLDAFSAEFTILPSRVVGRHVFYNNSTFDGNNVAADVQDNAARAYDKAALMPGRTATFANYTSYAKGLNGIMVDMAGAMDLAKLNAAEDFAFKVGNDSDPNGWANAPDPLSMTIHQGAGVGGSDRVTIIWPDNAIEKQWLQVTVRGTGNTGLRQDDIFYFGNAPGESGDETINSIVNATDEIVARNYQHGAVNSTGIVDKYDYNRDRLVNGTDQIIARENQTNPLTMLRLISAPAKDAALKQAVELETSEPTTLSAALDWLYEFEQMNAKNTRPKRSAAEEAVDRLLAIESI